MVENLPNRLVILGFSGGVLAAQFETLAALSYQGQVLIVRNEVIKRCDLPFYNQIPYREVMCDDIDKPNGSGFLLCSTKPGTKHFLYQYYQNLWSIGKGEFVSLAHPSAIISSTIKSEKGLHIEALSKIGPYSQIGFGVNVHSNCSIGHHNVIADFSTIQAGCNLAGLVEIGQGTTVGPGSNVFYQVKIGENCIIGGGSVVVKDIPANSIAYGSPCKVIRRNDV